MRIYHRETNEFIRSLLLFITPEETQSLILQLSKLLEVPETYLGIVKGEDVNGDMNKEIKLRIYTKTNLHTFDEKIQQLITKGTTD